MEGFERITANGTKSEATKH